MKEHVLLGTGDNFLEIPSETWKKHVEQAISEIPKLLSFMTKEHHLVRQFVVRELPRIAKPISAELLSNELNMSLSKTNEIIEDLERNLFFLVSNDQGNISWAFPVTVDKTPHELTFSTGERLNAA